MIRYISCSSDFSRMVNVLDVFFLGTCLSLENRMKLRFESFLPSRRTSKRTVLHLWDIYTSPVLSGRDVLTLLLLCSCLAAITGGLLYYWLAKTLDYSYDLCVQVACIYGSLMLLASFLCHPLRCVLTMTLPIACTKQGRKLLISASVMVLILNVIPNIALNFGVVAQILKCTTEGFTRSLLNSSRPLNKAKQDLVEETQRANLWSNINQLKQLAQLTNVDVSEVRVRFMEMIGQIEQNFSHTKGLLQKSLLLSNRIFAALFVALLVFESLLYLKSYLSSVQFGSSSKELHKESAGDSAARPRCPVSYPRCGIRSHERSSCVIALLVVTLYFLAITLTVILDYVVYRVVDLILPWLLDFPSTSAIFDVRYELKTFAPVLCLSPSACRTWKPINFHRKYMWTYDPEPSLCEATASPPSRGVCVLLGCLCVMSYFLVFLEVYAKRLCRKICASFFREQEKKRMEHLRKKEKKVFTITVNERLDITSTVGLGQRGGKN